MSGREAIPVPAHRRSVDGPHIVLEGARLHNLDGVDVSVPIGALTLVTGVSGSGKSTLVHDVLYRGLERKLAGQTSAKQHLGEPVGSYTALRGSGALTGVVLIDQSPIGRTPRSNAVTYLKAYSEIRRIFAELPDAGQLEVEMLFLADVFVPCEMCGGKRFKPEILEVRYRGRNIDEVLNLTVDQAIKFFIKEAKLGKMLWQLQRVGLGYLRLGQPATTLSGGEAQRLKLARELAAAGRRAGHKLYLLDEPTTGLHLHDVRRLLDVLEQLIDTGNTVIVIEHNLEVIKQGDWVIVVAMGRPEEIMANEQSYTGLFLREVLEGRVAASG
jgi:excinuclease ABC subunit A